MGMQIIKQPSGQFAIFDSVTDTVIVWDATEEEVVEYFAERAADRAREDARRQVSHVAAGNPRKAYFQFAMTWDEALTKDRKHGGTAWKECQQRG
ncbi:hypothetical protein [Nonomuraea wenchangensis]|uniref:Uncharacterized protein n=1 Tax=Nonomuraea wenchangensis TaxID=568860 RepID=A0A1I0ETU8_9ACTN|nr:hypothetical protein [Nonomuraea wenchangensis]SET48818.1 hypothetical protein SAMN05421811_103198 [Nonomuraea wenchangensis]